MREQLANNPHFRELDTLTYGFLDDQGNFLTREEAWVVAKEAGQIIIPVSDIEDRLFSEHLY